MDPLTFRAMQRACLDQALRLDTDLKALEEATAAGDLDEITRWTAALRRQLGQPSQRAMKWKTLWPESQPIDWPALWDEHPAKETREGNPP